ncbi:unnamed protein product [Malus baccata var. baccata]
MPLCIQYPRSAQDKTDEFELKSSLLHHILKFHGLSMEDPNKHLKEFKVVFSSMTPVNVDGSILKMKAFPFSLLEKAKDWLYELAPGTVTSWESMKRAFLEKFFPTSRVILLRKRISGIQQNQGESFPTYYERFKTLVASCPQHQMKEELLIQYFHERLLPIERQILDASAGGALVDKTPMAAKTLIANRALNAQQYEGVGQRDTPRQQHVNEVVGGPKVQSVVVCGMCSMQGHLTDKCPQLIKNGGWESTNAVGFGSQNQPKSDHFSNTYNPGDLKNDGVIIQLADRSNAYPKGVREDVLLQVNHLIFPANFYMLEMEESDHSHSLPILLGRPFMKTARTKIDVFNGTLTMEFDREFINFNLSESIKYPSDDHSCFSIDVIDSLAHDHFEQLNEDALELVITRGMEFKNNGSATLATHNMHGEHHVVPLNEDMIEIVAVLESLPP